VDLDGTLIRDSGEYFEPVWGKTDGIKENIQAINRLYDGGKVQIIVTTSRKEEARQLTIQQLEREGLRYHQIVFGLNHGKRIVVNDYSRSNPFKSCDSVNIAHDSAELDEMLEALFHRDEP
jgi:cupin superfamily acireductone dioxygenase involved in methionine salvage